MSLVSIIVPAYRQEKTIVKDILRIKKALVGLRYNFEVIVVVDGMVDKTFQRAKRLSAEDLRVVGYETNHGKGYAIRYGMVRAKGEIVGFIDSGMEINPNGLSIFLEHLEWYNADAIIGSKRHPVSKVTYPFDRKIISFLSQVFIKILFGVNVRDTQVGMKFFRREVIMDVLPRLQVKQFAFDIELLAVAFHLKYKRIFEAPIELNFNFKGSIISQRLLAVLLKTFWDTLAIFYRLKILGYYNNENKKNWKLDPDLISL